MSVKLRSESSLSCRCFYMILILVLSILVVLFLSTSTSFLYSYREQLDSVVFQIIGREWLNGNIPYRDLWDLKGPLIFFVNALGFLLTGSRYGIVLIQTLFLFIFFLIVFRYYREKVSSLKSFIGIIIICCFLSVVYEGGNMVEEYLLPLLIFSFIKMNNWLNNVKEKNYDHKWQFALVYGITFGFSFLTRITNALPLCFGVLYIYVFSICKNEWKSFLWNLGAFLVGFILIVLPFLVYFLITDTINDYFATLDFGFRYLVQSTQTIDIKKFLIFNFPVLFLLLVITVETFFYRNYYKLLFWLLVVVVSLCWIIKSRGYSHYSIIFLPYMVISLYEMASLNNICRRLAVIFVLLFVVRGLKHDLSYYYRLDEVKASNYIMNKMINVIPANDRNDLCIYGEVIVSPYLYYGICPNKYFYLQEENACISPSYKEKMLKDLSKVSPKFVITISKDKLLKEILDSCYSVYYSEHNVMIYQKRNNEKLKSNYI